MDNIKRIIGTLLTLLGIAGLGLSLIQYISISPETLNTKSITAVAGMAAVFFVSGIGLARTRKDEA